MQSDQAGTDELKEKKDKKLGKITNRMLHTDLDNIKDNQNNDLKKKKEYLIKEKNQQSTIKHVMNRQF